MQTDDATYYRRRAQEERERAAACKDSGVTLAHLAMADAYDQRADYAIKQLSIVASFPPNSRP